jgi:hypothetical protein
LLDLVLPKDETPHYGKYGMLRKTYLKEHRNSLYQALLLQGKLVVHLNHVDRDANEQKELLISQIVEKQEITEQMKAENQMLWLQKMNAVVNTAEEIVVNEIVYI